MKFKLTPSISYVIGLYAKSRAKKGIGVKGRAAIVFAKKAIELGLSKDGKMLYEENEVYFYNSKLKKFFEKILKEVSDRFIFANDYAASYFAGLYDAVGEIKDGKIYLGKYNIKDSVALQKLGFLNKKKEGKIVLEGREVEFLRFIKDYSVLKKKEIEEILTSLSL